MGASLLAKRPVNPLKMGRLGHRIREQAHFHRALGRPASGFEYVVRRRFVTQSVNQGIPTLEREERYSQLSCDA
ncbi:hypothetical protein ALQ78_05463 [Pseudomonas syringae pv. aptata]|nr:hypothetical protein ALQ78_05463 [Pseudomonas syringae pv. aptata]